MHSLLLTWFCLHLTLVIRAGTWPLVWLAVHIWFSAHGLPDVFHDGLHLFSIGVDDPLLKLGQGIPLWTLIEVLVWWRILSIYWLWWCSHVSQMGGCEFLPALVDSVEGFHASICAIDALVATAFDDLLNPLATWVHVGHLSVSSGDIVESWCHFQGPWEVASWVDNVLLVYGLAVQVPSCEVEDSFGGHDRKQLEDQRWMDKVIKHHA